MKKRILASVVIMAIAGLIFTQPLLATSIDDEKDKEQQMQQELSDANEILSSLESLKSDAQAYISAMDEKLNGITAHILELNAQMEAKQVEIDAANATLAEKEADIAEQYAAMKLRIQYMFENGSDLYLDMIIHSEDLADFLNRAEYAQQITSYDRSMLNKMKETKQQIEDTKATLGSEKQALSQLKMQEESEQSTVEQLIADKQKVVDDTNVQIADAQQQIAQKEQEIAAQNALIEEMERIEAQRKAEEEARRLREEMLRRQEEERRKQQEEEERRKAEAQANGETVDNEDDNHDDEEEPQLPSYSTVGFMNPIQDSYYISSPYGYRVDPINGEGAFHNGVDLACPSGTPVYAANDGQVSWANYNWSAGNWIGIDHGDGVYSIYMHNSAMLVSPGDYVKKGDIIALVGATGRVTGPHLHLSFRKDGTYVNPSIYVNY